MQTKMLNVAKSFHEGMHAEVRVGLTVTERFEVQNGLQQGCTLAPTLLNIYFNAMVADWCNRSRMGGDCEYWEDKRDDCW